MDLEDAIELASLAHHGQVDKCGESYILHPIRVMLRLTGDPEAMTVAVLHDTIEDTFVTAELLVKRGLALHLVEAVVALTRVDDEPYADYIERLGENPVARRVKLADLADNMDPRRNPEPRDETARRRLIKYERARQYLNMIEAMP